MVPLSELITRVRRRYEAEAGGSTTRFSDAAIKLYINEGLETLAEETGFYERYVTLPVAEKNYYDLRGFTPETVVTVNSVWSSTRNDWLKPITIEDLSTTWEQTVGDPQGFFMEGINWLVVYPRPSTSTTGYFRVHFQGVPGRFTHPQAVLGELPDDHVTALEDYALYEMAAADRSPKRALLHWASYQKREKAFRDFADRRLVANRAGRFGRFAGRMA